MALLSFEHSVNFSCIDLSGCLCTKINGVSSK